VPEAIGPAKISDDEHDAHHDRGDSEQFADDHDVVHLPVVIDVSGDHHHHAARREPDEEGEVRDVESPRDVIGHCGHGHAVTDLHGPGIRADQRYGGEQRHPRVEKPATIGRQHQ
jgi:hypothetical protein